MYPRTLLCVLPLVCSALLAQDGPPGPAPEVQKFHQFLGNWEGSGTVRPQADMPMRWTAIAHTTKVLDGHFVQEDLQISFEGEQAPPPLVFRNLYGFDTEKKRWMVYGISNMGTATEQQIHWVDGKMMTGGSKVEPDMMGQNQFIVERWSTTFGKDSYKTVGYETIGNGEPFAHVTGTFKRVKAVNASFSIGKAGAMVPPAPEMGALAKWNGTYHMKGWMVMAPGMPKTDITATEIIGTTLGGTVLEFKLNGDPIPGMGSYVGYGAMVWNQQDQCYKTIWVDNLGGSMMTDGYLRDGKLISGTFRSAMGEPVATSSVLTLAEDGSLAKIIEYAAFGAAAPIKMFDATYEKK